LIVADYCHEYSHWKAHQSLSDWLIEYDVPGITGVDTRMLTKMIRDAGEMKGKIVIGDNDVSWDVPELLHPVSEVSCKKPYTVGKGDIKILAIDTGMKDSMLRCLVARGATVKVVPYNYDISKEEYDGLFISNGPGDPMRCTETVSALKKALTEDKPIFGICLGTQLMALAAGAKTYKLPFGHRGQNQPCINVLDERCYITSQNHSYAVDENTLPEGWSPLFLNANDGSVEGIYHTTKPFFSVQFHPEARCGPEDTHFLFDKFLDSARRHKQRLAFDPSAGLYPFLNNDSVGLKLGQGDSLKSVVEFPKVYREPLPKKVLVLGSGGLQIGQAGEFDYSGSQCLKALKEEGIKTVLMNPNIATVQTAEGLADEVYFLPVTPEFVEAVIRKERPDAVMLQFGGQTALNCGIELHRTGVFSKNGVRVLGTSVESIIKTEDRDLFNQALAEINEKFATSISVYTVEDALKAADKIGYPIIARCGFALGGLGSGFADNANELRDLAKKALAVTPQILVEKSLRGWKELEYEVVRDASNNCVTVCNMENFDPLGIHTGDSIVVSPSQTLDDHEYHLLRNVSIRVVRHLGIIGECNIQYALDPNSDDYRIIEVNPRLSRSSALASKATGYPLAYVAARLALGMPLPHVKNAVTRKTTACFEPALDYIVCKVPRWDMAKFKNCNHVLGSAMKSVGEIMSVGRTFEEAFQKALRMVNDANTGFDPKASKKFPDMEHALRVATDDRIWALAQCMREGWSVDKVCQYFQFRFALFGALMFIFLLLKSGLVYHQD
jgi:carbamoyl-phosphate synthase small subunit